MPTRMPPPAARIGAMKGSKVSTIASRLTSTIRRNTARSSPVPVTVPALMPALAITMSGAPWRGDEVLAGRAQRPGIGRRRRRRIRRSHPAARPPVRVSRSARRATSIICTPGWRRASSIARALPRPLDAPVMTSRIGRPDEAIRRRQAPLRSRAISSSTTRSAASLEPASEGAVRYLPLTPMAGTPSSS